MDAEEALLDGVPVTVTALAYHVGAFRVERSANPPRSRASTMLVIDRRGTSDRTVASELPILLGDDRLDPEEAGDLLAVVMDAETRGGIVPDDDIRARITERIWDAEQRGTRRSCAEHDSPSRSVHVSQDMSRTPTPGTLPPRIDGPELRGRGAYLTKVHVAVELVAVVARIDAGPHDPVAALRGVLM